MQRNVGNYKTDDVTVADEQTSRSRKKIRVVCKTSNRKYRSRPSANNQSETSKVVNRTIGVNATGDAGDASLVIFGQPGTCFANYLNVWSMNKF